jgi:DNA-binding XRE family transcriptional regulator
MSSKIAQEARKMIASHLTERREELGISQEHLAHLVGVTKGTIYRFENGKFPPSFDMVLDIVRALDLYFFVSEKENGSDWSELMRNRWGQNDSPN